MKLTDKSDILGLLHDQRFDLEDIKHDKTTQILKIKFQCEIDEERKLFKKSFLLKEYSIPLAEATLTISNAFSYKLVGDKQMGVGMLNTYSFREDQGELIIDAIMVKLIVEPIIHKLSVNTQ